MSSCLAFNGEGIASTPFSFHPPRNSCQVYFLPSMIFDLYALPMVTACPRGQRVLVLWLSNARPRSPRCILGNHLGSPFKWDWRSSSTHVSSLKDAKLTTILILWEKLHKILRKNVLYYNLLEMFFFFLIFKPFYFSYHLCVLQLPHVLT